MSWSHEKRGWIRGKHARLVLLVLIVAIAAGVLSHFQWFAEDRPFTYTLRTSDELAAKHPDRIQLVGFVRFMRIYGILSGKHTPEAAQMSLTVLRKGNQYYTVGGEPSDFLRSLLDGEKHPLLAEPPKKMERLPGSSDDEALRNAMEQLVEEFERP